MAGDSNLIRPISRDLQMILLHGIFTQQLVAFCEALGISVGAFQQLAVATIDGSEVEWTGTSDGFDVAASGLSTTPFALDGNDVWFEWTLTSANANAGLGNFPNVFTSGPGFASGVVIIVNAAGTEFEMYTAADVFASPPPVVAPQNPDFINKTLNFPYTVQTRLNGTTGEISWEDFPNGNSGSLGSFPGITSAAIDIAPLAFGNLLSGTQDSTFNLNAGRAAPVISPPAGFVTWCHEDEPLPPGAGFCNALIGLEPHWLLSGGIIDEPLGITLTQTDTTFNFLNVSGGVKQSTFLGAPQSYNIGVVGPFIDVTYNSASTPHYDNFIIAAYMTILLGFLPIGFGLLVAPRTHTSDGTLYFSGGFTPPLRVRGSQLFFTDVGGLSTDEFVLTYVSGDDGDLEEIGFEFSTSTPGTLGVSDSTLGADGFFRPMDYSVTPLVFNVQLGANPAVTVSLTGDEDDIPTIAASIESQLQTGGTPKIVRFSSGALSADPGGGSIFIHGVETVILAADDLPTAINKVVNNVYTGVTEIASVSLLFGTEIGIEYTVAAGDFTPVVSGTGDVPASPGLTVEQAYAGNPAAYANVTVDAGVGMNIAPGYNIVFGIDPINNEMPYEDSLGNSETLDLSAIFTTLGAPGFEGAIGTAPASPYLGVQVARYTGIDNDLDVTFNGGKYEQGIDISDTYKPFCELPEWQQPYAFNAPPFSGSQGINSVSGRLVTLTNDIGQPDGPAAVGVFRDIVASQAIFEGNCFEAHLTTKEAGCLEEQWQVGINSFLQEDIRLSRETGTYSSQPGATVLRLTAEFPSSINHELANNLPDFGVDDVMTICVFPNPFLGVDPTDHADKSVQVQFVVKIGSDVVIYDKLFNVRASGSSADAPLSAFTMLGDITGSSNDNLPNGASAEVTFNGIEGDYLVDRYPDYVVDYNGADMSAKTDPWIRTAALAPWNIEASASLTGTIVYSNPVEGLNKTIAITTDGANINGVKAHLPLFIPSRTLAGDVVVVGMGIDVAGGDFELICTTAQSGSVNDVVRIAQNGPNVTLFRGVDQFTLKNSHTLSAGDEIYLEFDTNIGGEVIAYLWDGVSVSESTAGVGFNGDVYESFIVQMETKNVPTSTTSQFTSLCKAADIDTGGNITFTAGAIDMEGVTI